MAGQKQFNERDVLDKAVSTFWSRGYNATSMRTLVECMGINRASLYATFGGKRELFLSSLRSYTEAFCQTELPALERVTPPSKAIRELFLYWIGQSGIGDAPRGCFLNNTAVELANIDPEVNRIVTKFQNRTESFLRAKIIEGQAVGEIRADLDPDATGARLLASMLGMLVLARSGRAPGRLTDIVDNTIASIT